MKSDITISVQGVNGGDYREQQNKGAVIVKVDYDAVNDRRIYFDAFSGQGQTYKRREETLIMVYDKKGVPVFSGTFDQLVSQLTKGVK